MKEVKLSTKIYSKDFSIRSLGYSCEEVDRFLDEINVEIAKLERELATSLEKYRTSETLRISADKKYKELNLELCKLKASKTVESSSSANFSNIELLNRIANLESMVQQLLDNNKDKS